MRTGERHGIKIMKKFLDLISEEIMQAFEDAGYERAWKGNSFKPPRSL